MWFYREVEDDPESMKELDQNHLNSTMIVQEKDDCHEENSLLEEGEDVGPCWLGGDVDVLEHIAAFSLALNGFEVVCVVHV